MFWNKDSDNTTYRKRRLLKLFNLTDTVENHLIERMTEHTFAKGEVIIREGDSGNSLYFIASGNLIVLKRNTTGHEVEIAHMKAGDFFGEISFLKRKPRTSTVIAAETSQIFELEGKASLVFLVTSTPDLMNELKNAALMRLKNDKDRVR